ncbi:MAG: ATP-binding cassette domain-containing protein [Corynebacterium sp.]|nr:ATP-binding cassette domain-containing protein [Corynebacterium sp.]
MLQLDNVAREGFFQPVNLSVSAGERVVVSAPSGSGKTLLLRSIAELDPHIGTLLLDGRLSRTWGIPAWRSQVMYVPQRIAFLPGTVRDVLRHAFQFKTHKAKTFSEDEAAELLRTLGRSSKLLDRETNHLSGGEAQSVALIRALLLSPRVLLTDEITSDLDHALAGRVETLLIEWTSQPGRALMWVGHNAAENERIATSTITLGKP